MGVGGKGRPAEPTALKLVKGTRKDRVNDKEPIPSDDLEVVPPAWLSEEAIVEWDRLAPDLISTGVLTAWDVQAFAEWCAAVARNAEAERHLQAEGEIVEQDVFDRNGKPTGTRLVMNPWFYVQRSALETTAKRAARFGLTPAERSGVAVDRGTNGAGNDPAAYLS